MKISKKLLIILICAVIAVCSTVGGTVAYIFSKGEETKNSFEPVFVSCDVEETVHGQAKTDIKVRNTGDISAYIRATFVVMWVSDSGSVHSSSPVKNVDYTVNFGSEKWVIGSDGFYYYTSPVLTAGVTETFILSISPVGEAPDGYSLAVHVAATAIQAEPTNAVNETWGATVQKNGQLTPP
jgi:hypothetical protein